MYSRFSFRIAAIFVICNQHSILHRASHCYQNIEKSLLHTRVYLHKAFVYVLQLFFGGFAQTQHRHRHALNIMIVEKPFSTHFSLLKAIKIAVKR